ncbi:MAG: hypothetical protein R2827_10980 [Bdellovibrionales bacterium]
MTDQTVLELREQNRQIHDLLTDVLILGVYTDQAIAQLRKACDLFNSHVDKEQNDLIPKLDAMSEIGQVAQVFTDEVQNLRERFNGTLKNIENNENKAHLVDEIKDLIYALQINRITEERYILNLMDDFNPEKLNS